MKDMLSNAISEKVSAALESTGGIQSLYGDPVTVGGEEIVPVGRISIQLGAAAEGSGSGDSGAAARLTGKAKGGGGGSADASVRIEIEPLGFVRTTANGPEFVGLGD